MCQQRQKGLQEEKLERFLFFPCVYRRLGDIKKRRNSKERGKWIILHDKEENLLVKDDSCAIHLT